MSVGMSGVQAADTPPESVAVDVKEGFKFRAMTDEERNSAMCILGATTGMAASYAVGPSEVIMLVVGGVVVPSSSSILFWGLFGTIAAAGCAIGELATPATSWLYNHYFSGS
jgi:hypothetical protein